MYLSCKVFSPIRCIRINSSASLGVFYRNCSSSFVKTMESIKAYGATFKTLGPPTQVLSVEDIELNKMDTDSVLLKILASPVNPADLGYIYGQYGHLPDLSKKVTPGMEGLMEVINCGSNVKTLQKGDWVVPNIITSRTGVGCWKSHTVQNEKNLIKVRKGKLEAMATCLVNPMTAYYLLHEVVKLEKGDTVIQSGANSTCGTYIIQLCKLMGVNTINIIRDRPNFEEVEKRLKSLGGTVVIRQEDLKNFDPKSSGLKPPILGIDCVAGPLFLEMTQKIQNHGYMVNYGGMDGKPITMNIGTLIFRGITIRGFWLTYYIKPKFKEDLDYIVNLIYEGKLEVPNCKMINIPRNGNKELKEGLTQVTNYKSGVKYLLCFND